MEMPIDEHARASYEAFVKSAGDTTLPSWEDLPPATREAYRAHVRGVNVPLIPGLSVFGGGEIGGAK